jgi:hypothetical protein
LLLEWLTLFSHTILRNPPKAKPSLSQPSLASSLDGLRNVVLLSQQVLVLHEQRGRSDNTPNTLRHGRHTPSWSTHHEVLHLVDLPLFAQSCTRSSSATGWRSPPHVVDGIPPIRSCCSSDVTRSSRPSPNGAGCFRTVRRRRNVRCFVGGLTPSATFSFYLAIKSNQIISVCVVRFRIVYRYHRQTRPRCATLCDVVRMASHDSPVTVMPGSRCEGGVAKSTSTSHRAQLECFEYWT